MVSILSPNVKTDKSTWDCITDNEMPRCSDVTGFEPTSPPLILMVLSQHLGSVHCCRCRCSVKHIFWFHVLIIFFYILTLRWFGRTSTTSATMNMCSTPSRMIDDTNKKFPQMSGKIMNSFKYTCIVVGPKDSIGSKTFDFWLYSDNLAFQ